MTSELLKDYLQDIVRHGLVLGPDTILKIDGEDGNIKVSGKRDDGSIIFKAELKNKISEINEIFGISNLPMLSSLLNSDCFRGKSSKVEMIKATRNNKEILTQIKFKQSSANVGITTASFKLTAKAMIPMQPTKKASGNSIVIEGPTKQKINELRQLTSIFSGYEDTFMAKVENGNLIFLLGQESATSHTAKVVFKEGVEGTLPTGFLWSVVDMLNILRLSETAETVIIFNDTGSLLEIVLDTGLGVYTYMLPGKN